MSVDSPGIPSRSTPNEPDIQAIQRVCNVHNVSLATNIATANFIISEQAV